MNERVLAQRLEGWYANEVGGVTAPASLRASVADIPYTTGSRFGFPRSPVLALALLLALLIALAIGAVWTGTFRLRLASLSTDEIVLTVDDRVIAVDVRTGTQHDMADGTVIALSPDRSQFIRATSAHPFECFVTSVGGTDERRLDACSEHTSASTATWSPDGRKVLFYDRDYFLADVASGHVTRLPWKESFKDTGTGGWSPDGRKIVIPARGQLVIADADGHELGLIPTRSYAYSFGPRWSPDGRSILFWTLYGRWVVVNAEVGGAQFGKEVMSGTGSFPAWSPDGTRIAYISGYTLRVEDSDGRNDRLLDAHAYPWGPQWSPDGSRILFGSNNGESGTLAGPMMVVDAASGESHVVFRVFSRNYIW